MTSKVHYITDTSKIEDEALDWLMLLDREDTPSDEVLSELKLWLNASPEHAKALKQFNQFWSNQVLTDLHVSLSSPPERKIIKGWHYTLASSFAIMLAVFLFINPANNLPLYAQTVIAASGKQDLHALPDGSTIYLNSNSELKISYTNNFRNLHLIKGKAHFEVKKENRPFRVYAAGGRVEAIGTAFTVEVEANDLSVLVTEGVVALASKPNTDINNVFSNELTTLGAINAGNKALIDTQLSIESLSSSFNQLVNPVSEREFSKVQSLLEGTFVFFGEPLEQVITEISDFTSVNIELTDPDLKALSIGGRFNANDLDQFFALLESNFSIKVIKINENKIVITKG